MTPEIPASKNPPHDDFRFNTTPNHLTLLRIGFVPLVVFLLFQGEKRWDIVAAIVFAVASITDYFDGYLARVQKIETVYGKLMDPMADKFLVVSCLVTLQHLDRIHPVVVILLICREIAITGLRALASAEGVIIPASPSAKWKTAFQMVAIGFLMVYPGIWGIPSFRIGEVLLYISLGISLWSAKDYIADFFRGAKEQRKRKTREKRIAREARLAARRDRWEARAKKHDIE